MHWANFCERIFILIILNFFLFRVGQHAEPVTGADRTEVAAAAGSGSRGSSRSLEPTRAVTPPPPTDILFSTFGLKLSHQPVERNKEQHQQQQHQQDNQQQQQRRAETASRILNIRNDIFRNFADPEPPEAASNRREPASMMASLRTPEEPPLSSPPPAAVAWTAVEKDSRLGGLSSSLLVLSNVPAAAALEDSLAPLSSIEEEHELAALGVSTLGLAQLPPETQKVVEDEPEIKMEEGKGLMRCNLCPSPGAIAIEDRPVHLDFHREKLFTCAACPRRREFESFDEIVCHINISHNVRDSQMVLETIILPEAGSAALRHYKCGVPNCQKSFVAMPESELRAHIIRCHGEYYVRLGRGRLLRRHCRVCGEDQSFGSEAELDGHISDCHPRDQFAPSLEELEQAETAAIEPQQQQEKGNQNDESLTSGLLTDFRHRDRPQDVTAYPRTASAALSEPGLLPEEAAAMPVPVFGKPLPAATVSSEPLSDHSGQGSGHHRYR
jgi:hypothetical protein